MVNLRLVLRIAATLLVSITALRASASDPQAVFQNPPESAKTGVWWHWMGCNVTKQGITRDLESLKRAGIGGATIFGMADVCNPWGSHIENSPTEGLIAFTDPWWEMVRHAAEEGRRLGIDVGLHNCPGYTSSGGPWITPELSMQQIYQSQTPMEGLLTRGIHRTDGASHVFFLAHEGSGGNATCRFDIEGMQPELWDPVTGTMRELTDFRFEDGKTVVPLKFAPAQSWFVVFRKKAVAPLVPKSNFPELQTLADITGPWDVSFDPEWGGPPEVKFNALQDWTNHSEPGIRYYSGTATYRKTFDGANGSWLDLGRVNHIARVRLNGRDLGVASTAPWGVEIPAGLLKPKGNQLEIEVANVWANRLIGDEQEPPDCEWLPGHHFADQGGYLKRFPDWFVKNEPRPSKGRYCFVTWNYFTKDSTLIPSGLMGPVKIMTPSSNL